MGADRQTPNQIKNTVQKLPTAKDFRDTFYLNFKKTKTFSVLLIFYLSRQTVILVLTILVNFSFSFTQFNSDTPN